MHSDLNRRKRAGTKPEVTRGSSISDQAGVAALRRSQQNATGTLQRIKTKAACALLIFVLSIGLMPVLLDLARPHLKRLCIGNKCLGSPAGACATLAAAARAAAPVATAEPQQQRRRGESTSTRAFSGGAGAGAMPLTYRPPIVVRPTQQHTGTVIMLRECSCCASSGGHCTAASP